MVFIFTGTRVLMNKYYTDLTAFCQENFTDSRMLNCIEREYPANLKKTTRGECYTEPKQKPLRKREAFTVGRIRSVEAESGFEKNPVFLSPSVFFGLGTILFIVRGIQPIIIPESLKQYTK